MQFGGLHDLLADVDIVVQVVEVDQVAGHVGSFLLFDDFSNFHRSEVLHVLRIIIFPIIVLGVDVVAEVGPERDSDFVKSTF